MKKILFLLAFISVAVMVAAQEDKGLGPIVQIVNKETINDGLSFTGPHAVWKSVVSNELSNGLSAPLYVSDNLLLAFLKGEDEDIKSGYICSLNPQDGSLLWAKNIGGVCEHPLFLNDVIYVGSADGNFYAIDKYGNVKWNVKTGNWGNSGYRTRAIAYNNVIVFGYDDGFLYAVNKSDGKLKWKKEINGILYASPYIENDVLYFGTSGGDIYALSYDNGNEVWRKHIKDDIFFLNFLPDEESIAFLWTDNKGANKDERKLINVSALSKKDGSIQWTNKIYSENVISWAVGAFGNIYFTDGNKLKAFSIKDGRNIWEFDGNVDLYPFLEIIEDKVLVVNGSQYENVMMGDKCFMYALNVISGEVLWQQEIGGGAKNSFSILSDNIILQYKNKDGRDVVVFLDLNNGEEKGRIELKPNESLNDIMIGDDNFYMTTKSINGNTYIYKMNY